MNSKSFEISYLKLQPTKPTWKLLHTSPDHMKGSQRGRIVCGSTAHLSVCMNTETPWYGYHGPTCTRSRKSCVVHQNEGKDQDEEIEKKENGKEWKLYKPLIGIPFIELKKAHVVKAFFKGSSDLSSSPSAFVDALAASLDG